jgi:MFS family permease
MRFGIRPPLVAGLLMAAASLALFGRAPVHGSFLVDVLPSMVLLGAGAGLAFNPVLLAAMGDVEPHESGLASGVVNTSFMMGGALGLAVFVSLSSGRMSSELAHGAGQVAALNSGLQVAFVAAAVAALLAAGLAGALLRPKPMTMPEGAEAGQAGERVEHEEPDPEPCAA